VVARTEKLLLEVKQECMDLGLKEDRLILCPGNITSTADLLEVRETILKGRNIRLRAAVNTDEQRGMGLTRSIFSRVFLRPRHCSILLRSLFPTLDPRHRHL
jgi:hypothetical protein